MSERARATAEQALTVWVNDVACGVITRTPLGASFSYRDDYAGPLVSSTLPRQDRPVASTGVNLHPFFANLLPEGARLSAVLRAVKTDKDDLLSLLAVVGRDTIGYVSVTPTKMRAASIAGADASEPVDPKKLGELSFDTLFAQSVDYPGGEHASVPGVQEKLSASVISFPIQAASQGESALGYILKLSPPRYVQLVENEAFFMRQAKLAGIRAAEVSLVQDRDGKTGLLVRRFDRVRMGPRSLATKVRQEDACQLLDRYPADKYAVSLRDIVSTLTVCDAPVLAAADLLRLYLYSYVIGNGDLHAKNISVYFPKDAPAGLTPAYDLLSTFPYGDKHMALKLDGRDTNFTRQSIVAFAARHRVRKAVADMIIDQVLDSVPLWISELGAIGWDTKTTRALRKEIERRRDRM
jgi:serine/threonine-protein kinase HipA